MKETIVQYSDIVTEELLKGTLDHNVHTGFLEDYRVLSCLLKIHRPKSILETGTNVGGGINVMKAALPDLEIFSLDLDYETMKLNSKQYPIGPNGEDRVGSCAKVPYTQLRGDSLTFDYSKYPVDAAWIDSEHDEAHPYHETKEILKHAPKIVIAHDCDIPEVWAGFSKAVSEAMYPYKLMRVEGTRIGYCVLESTIGACSE